MEMRFFAAVFLLLLLVFFCSSVLATCCQKQQNYFMPTTFQLSTCVCVYVWLRVYFIIHSALVYFVSVSPLLSCSHPIISPPV